MKMTDTKRLPNFIITNRIEKIENGKKRIVELESLKDKPKALLFYLYVKANIPKGIHKMCKCEYKEILEELDITVDKNYKKKVTNLLNDLVKASYIDYRVNSEDTLEIEVLIEQNPKGNFTKLPYSITNNKDIPLILVPTYVAILCHDFESGKCNASTLTLAKYSGCSKPTVIKRIQGLENLNLIEVSKSKGGAGGIKSTNTYYTSDGESFFYELIDVEKTRFDYKKKPLIKKKAPSAREIIQNKHKEQEELLEDVR